MPIQVEGTRIAYVLYHDQTWDWGCKYCLKEGESVKMKSRMKGNIIRIQCPRCGINEIIGEHVEDVDFQIGFNVFHYIKKKLRRLQKSLFDLRYKNLEKRITEKKI